MYTCIVLLKLRLSPLRCPQNKRAVTSTSGNWNLVKTISCPCYTLESIYLSQGQRPPHQGQITKSIEEQSRSGRHQKSHQWTFLKFVQAGMWEVVLSLRLLHIWIALGRSYSFFRKVLQHQLVFALYTLPGPLRDITFN